ncbi:MAG: hypothetical protein O2999_15075 [Nitrospirae bacterium]|nr:hypothetical protein [Nitrospirota bacterium]
MVTVRQGIIGVVSVVFLLGGVTLVTPFGSEADAGGLKKYFKNHVSTKDLQQDHEELDGKLNMLKDATEVLEANQQMIKDTQA